jgi:NADH-quinone oxidoreductase subunit N
MSCFCGGDAPDNYLFECKYYESLLKAVTLLAAMAALRCVHAIDDGKRSLLMLSLLGALTMFSCNNFISFYISAELMTVPLYFLPERNLRNHSFFIYNISFSCVFTAAALMICWSTGFTKFNDVRYALSFFSKHNQFILFAAVLMLLSICMKLGLSLGHSYIFDVLADKNMFAALCLGRISTIIGAYKVLAAVLYYVDLSTIIAILAGILILHGCIFMNGCSDLKKLVAHIYIWHSGMLLLGSACRNYSAIGGVLFIGLSDLMFMLGALFFLTSIKKNREPLKNIMDFRFLSSRNTGVAVAISLLIASSLGLLPLIGLGGKIYLGMALIEKKLYVAALIVAFSLLMGTIFTAKILDIFWFRKFHEQESVFFAIDGRWILLAPYIMLAAIPLAIKISSLLELELYFMR